MDQHGRWTLGSDEPPVGWTQGRHGPEDQMDLLTNMHKNKKSRTEISDDHMYVHELKVCFSRICIYDYNKYK